MNDLDRRKFCGGVAAAAVVAAWGGQASAQTNLTTLALIQTKIPSTVTSIVTVGYAVAGDKGNATYVRMTGTMDPRGYITSADGAHWTPTDTRMRPEMFGGKADGVTDSGAAITRALFFSRPIDLQAGTYLTSIKILKDMSGSDGTVPVEIAGAGIASTSIILTNYVVGIEVLGSTTNRTKIWLHDFKIGRTNAAAYTGVIGQHTIEVLYGSNVLIANIEEYGAIGMGIYVGQSNQVEISGCYVHDHKGGAVQLSGTDGIHVDQIKGTTQSLIHGNQVANVGDDGISHTSLSTTVATTNIRTYNNILQNVAGSIKVYGNCSNITIQNNTVTNGRTAGISLWDDISSTSSYTISNILIDSNILVGCGGPGASAAIYLAQTSGTDTSLFTNVTITNNKISSSVRGISVYSSVATKKVSNVVIQNNVIDGSTAQGMYLNNIGGTMTVDSNTVTNSGTHGISIAAMYVGSFAITNNLVSGIITINPAPVPVTHFAGIYITGGNTATASSFNVSKNKVVNAVPAIGKGWAIWNNIGVHPTDAAVDTVLGNVIDVTTLGISSTGP